LAAAAVAAVQPTCADSYFKDGSVHLLQLSHQDLGWHRGSYEGEMRSTFHAVQKGLQLVESDPAFKYDGELAIWLHDYLQHHSDETEVLRKRIRERRVQWGAGYAQPYTSLVTSEQLARLMYLGRRWYKKEFGADTTLYYNTDVPGMTAQMPQVLAKAGVDKAYMSRSWNLDGVRTDFLNWSAPDGSSIFCFMMNHYADYIDWRPGTPRIANDPERMTKWIAEQEAEYRKRKIPPVLPHLISKDCVAPQDLRKLMDDWNSHAADNDRPPMEYDSISDMMDRVKTAQDADFKTLAGEWPNKWIYEGAPANYEMFTDQRAAARLLCAAEAFGTFRALTEGTWEDYPTERLFEAWKAVNLACHGMAPDKCIENFLRKYGGARTSGQAMLDASLSAIAARVKTIDGRGMTPVVVFNSLSWERTDVVRMPLPDTWAGCRVLDGHNKKVPCQVVGSEVVFLAREMPSFGYSAFYLEEAPAPSSVSQQVWDEPFENSFFHVTPGKQGIASIFDKELKRELLKTDKFEMAQWLDFAYKGQGAGEHVHIRLPDEAPLEQLGAFAAAWARCEEGPLFTVFRSRETRTPRAKVSFELRLYHPLKRIDLACTMRDCDEQEARQVRLAFPLNADFEHVAYEAPFGKVEIGKDDVQRQLAFQAKKTKEEIQAYESLRVTDLEKWKRLRRSFYGKTPVRPREIQNWIYGGDGEAGITIASSVIAWDYLDASAQPVDYPVLQPVLLCSAYSCSRWKHCWTQPGDHRFSFSIYSHAGDWRNGYRRGVAANNPLIPVGVRANPAGTLPPRKSFLNCSATNIIVTAVKKAEDSGDVVVRFYEAAGKANTRAGICVDAPIKSARRTNLIEEDAAPCDMERGAAVLDVSRYSIETLKLIPEF